MNINEFTRSYINSTTVDFNKHFKDVILWNLVASPDHDHDLSDKKYIKQAELVMEEYRELTTALEKNDVVEIYDGLADLFVVLSYLYALDSARSECNIDYSDFVVTVNRYTEVYDIFDVPVDDVQNYLLNAKSDEIVVALDKLLKQLAVISYSSMVLNDVMRSNWSKYPEVDTVDADAEIARIEAAGRYTGITSSTVVVKNRKLYVFRDGTGKIMKPSTMSQPRIAEIIGYVEPEAD